jgi:hypothetical protein
MNSTITELMGGFLAPDIAEQVLAGADRPFAEPVMSHACPPAAIGQAGGRRSVWLVDNRQPERLRHLASAGGRRATGRGAVSGVVRPGFEDRSRLKARLAGQRAPMTQRDPDEADPIEPEDEPIEEPHPVGRRQAAINRENDPPA